MLPDGWRVWREDLGGRHWGNVRAVEISAFGKVSISVGRVQ